MKAVWARFLVLFMLVTWTMALSALALSANASAAGVSGTWVSRIPGEGYTQTYMGPGGSMVTEYFDIELVLSGPDSAVTGTVTATGGGYAKTYPVDGTFDGTTFLMTAYYGWDGVSYLTPTYTLAVSGNQMYGSASYLNVGVTIYGTFDLEKEGLLAVGGVTPVVSAASITVAIVAIVMAATPPKVPRTGVQPHVARYPSSTGYEPSPQWTTEVPPQPISGDGTTPVGGAGLQYPTPPPPGKPLSPRDHFTKVSQEPPRCPVHNEVALTPHYSADMNDPGSWFCPRCKGYPWGRS